MWVQYRGIAGNLIYVRVWRRARTPTCRLQWKLDRRGGGIVTAAVSYREPTICPCPCSVRFCRRCIDKRAAVPASEPQTSCTWMVRSTSVQSMNPLRLLLRPTIDFLLTVRRSSCSTTSNSSGRNISFAGLS